MDYFGDESGHFRGLLNGHCEVCVVAVIAGARIDCIRCAKKTVRDVPDIPEAKWNDLNEVQKRRFFECIADEDHLQFGYAAFTKSDLHSVQNYHHLYQDVCFPPDWDLALIGYVYGEIMFEMGVKDDRLPVFEFDRVASQKQSEAIAEHITKFAPEAKLFHASSRQKHGIQTADCFAGGIAEDLKGDTDWLSMLDDDRVYDCKSLSLIQLEKDLHQVETGP